MDSSGRIVIPKEVRRRLGTTGPAEFELDLVLDRIELTPVATSSRKGGIIEKDGMWVAAATGNEFNAASALGQDREDRMNAISRPAPATPGTGGANG